MNLPDKNRTRGCFPSPQICLLLTTLILVACSGSQSETPARQVANSEGQVSMQLEQVDTATGLALLENPEVLVLDIRTPREFQAGTLPGALNIVWGSSDFAAQVAELERSRPILLFCRSGNRTSQSLAVFEDLGFSRIYHLRDGIRRVPQDQLIVPD